MGHGTEVGCYRKRNQYEDEEVCIEIAKEEIENKKLEFSSSSEMIQPKTNCCEDKVLLIKTIVSGQFLSFMLCGTGTAATSLSIIYGVTVPCFNAFTMYTMLAFTFGIYTVRNKGFVTLLKKHGWKYFLVALLDVEANFLLTKAYSYTTLTSVQLCDSFTIPSVMIVSFIFLRVRYKAIHYVGVIICISGAVCLVLSDNGDKKENASNELAGDIMALCAAVLYGISQVGQEYLVKKYSWKTYLGMVGMVGFVLSAIQTVAIEKDDIYSIKWTWQIGLVCGAFAVCQYFYYVTMPYVMKLSSATVVDLSLLTSDLYTLIVGLFLLNYEFSYVYFIAFGGIFAGLVIYNIRPTPHAPPREKKKNVTKKGVTTSSFKEGKWYVKMLQRNESRSPLLKKDMDNNTIQYTQL